MLEIVSRLMDRWSGITRQTHLLPPHLVLTPEKRHKKKIGISPLSVEKVTITAEHRNEITNAKSDESASHQVNNNFQSTIVIVIISGSNNLKIAKKESKEPKWISHY